MHAYIQKSKKLPTIPDSIQFGFFLTCIHAYINTYIHTEIEEAAYDTVVPEFNTLLAFHVPRLYEITKVLAEKSSRYCVFGWSLQEGELYDLNNIHEQPPALQKRCVCICVCVCV